MSSRFKNSDMVLVNPGWEAEREAWLQRHKRGPYSITDTAKELVMERFAVMLPGQPTPNCKDIFDRRDDALRELRTKAANDRFTGWGNVGQIRPWRQRREDVVRFAVMREHEPVWSENLLFDIWRNADARRQVLQRDEREDAIRRGVTPMHWRVEHVRPYKGPPLQAVSEPEPGPIWRKRTAREKRREVK